MNLAGTVNTTFFMRFPKYFSALLFTFPNIRALICSGMTRMPFSLYGMKIYDLSSIVFSSKKGLFLENSCSFESFGERPIIRFIDLTEARKYDKVEL